VIPSSASKRGDPSFSAGKGSPGRVKKKKIANQSDRNGEKNKAAITPLSTTEEKGERPSSSSTQRKKPLTRKKGYLKESLHSGKCGKKPPLQKRRENTSSTRPVEKRKKKRKLPNRKKRTEGNLTGKKESSLPIYASSPASQLPKKKSDQSGPKKLANHASFTIF